MLHMVKFCFVLYLGASAVILSGMGFLKRPIQLYIVSQSTIFASIECVDCRCPTIFTVLVSSGIELVLVISAVEVLYNDVEPTKDMPCLPVGHHGHYQLILLFYIRFL